MLIKNVLELIGQTPLLEIDPKVHGLRNIKLYAKLEHLNPFGSIKDRAAYNMLKAHLPELKEKGMRVIESSSGNMAKAMQVICSMHGIPFDLVSNRIQVSEVEKILRILGANVNIYANASSSPSPDNADSPVAQIKKIVAAAPDKYLHTTQYTNDDNRQTHFDTTGPEIAADLQGKIDFFIAPTGTSGSSRGTGEYLRSQNENLNVIGIVSAEDHAIPGARTIAEMRQVGLFRESFYNTIVEATVDDAIDGMLTLARKLGVLAGPTSGATFTAGLKQLHEIDKTLSEEKTAVFIVCDRMEPYTSYVQTYRPEVLNASTPDFASKTQKLASQKMASQQLASQQLLAQELPQPPL